MSTTPILMYCSTNEPVDTLYLSEEIHNNHPVYKSANNRTIVFKCNNTWLYSNNDDYLYHKMNYCSEDRFFTDFCHVETFKYNLSFHQHPIRSTVLDVQITKGNLERLLNEYSSVSC